MRVRWTTDAADDLERICAYIALERPDSARHVAESVVERINELEAFPRIGRSGRVAGTREIAFPPLPYVAVYEILEARDECECCVSFMVRSGGLDGGLGRQITRPTHQLPDRR